MSLIIDFIEGFINRLINFKELFFKMVVIGLLIIIINLISGYGYSNGFGLFIVVFMVWFILGEISLLLKNVFWKEEKPVDEYKRFNNNLESLINSGELKAGVFKSENPKEFDKINTGWKP